MQNVYALGLDFSERGARLREKVPDEVGIMQVLCGEHIRGCMRITKGRREFLRSRFLGFFVI